jgi:hypothetical protein
LNLASQRLIDASTVMVGSLNKWNRYDTEQEKKASCERLERAKRFTVSFNGLLGEAFLKLFPSRSGSRFLVIFLATPFSLAV